MLPEVIDLSAMPSSMSTERRKMLLFLGAKIVITPKEMGMNGAIEKAKKIHKDTPNSIILDQFENQANLRIHYKTTAQEIWSSVDGLVTLFLWSRNRRNNYRSGNFFKGKKRY